MDRQSIINKINQIKADLSQLADSIRDLPPNPNVEHLGNNCFSIKLNEIAKYDKWSPDFHNFEYQYNYIATLIEDFPIDEVLAKLDRIIKTERSFWKGNTIMFHPDVIQNLKSIIN